jgi:Flp pilus assembly protein TadG
MHHVRTGSSSKTNCRSAGAAVEFGFVAVVLATLLGGMIEIGRAVMVKSILTDASRKGAAAAAKCSGTYTDITNDVDDILNTDHQLPATLANGKATLTVTVAPWDASTKTYGSDVQVNSSTFTPGQYDKVSVKVTVQTSDVSWFFLKYTAGEVESESVIMMRH